MPFLGCRRTSSTRIAGIGDGGAEHDYQATPASRIPCSNHHPNLGELAACAVPA